VGAGLGQFWKVRTMTDDNRGMVDFGRSMLKQVANLSRAKDENPVEPVGAPPPMQQVVSVSAAKPAAPANDVTVISPNVQLSGTIITPDELHVAGKVNGNIAASAITVRATGVVTGDVAADVLIVHGRIEGRIYAKMVKLAAGATVIGDIVAGQLGIDTDAVFEGASKRSPDALAEAPEFAKAA
jgi:cytoskeletal protein CcmA (bactofilin family)